MATVPAARTPQVAQTAVRRDKRGVPNWMEAAAGDPRRPTPAKAAVTRFLDAIGYDTVEAGMRQRRSPHGGRRR
jgi:hypothetical protein